MQTSSVSLALALLTLSSLAHGDAWTVDPSGAGDFTEVQAAVDAAAAGDTILVKAGTYDDVVLDKGVTVTAAAGAIVELETLSITGLPPTEAAVLRGLKVQRGVVVESSAGAVWLEEITEGNDSSSKPGLEVTDSYDVVIVRSRFVGGNGVQFLGSVTFPATGLKLVDASLHAFDTILIGGGGSGAEWADGQPGQDGTPGATLDGAFLVLSGCTVEGGSGGFPDHHGGIGCLWPGDGGAGVAFEGAPSEAHAIDTVVQGGIGGIDFWATGCGDGEKGPVTAGPGTVATFDGEALQLATGRAVAFGGALDVALSGGPAGAPAFLALGLEPDALFVPVLSGAVVVAPPYLVLSLGALDGAGGLALSFETPAFPASVGAALYFGQSGYLASSGAVVLGGASAVVLVDPAL